MFDWFWEFLYSISQILFEIIDGLMSIANLLCGIEPITVESGQTDFLSYLLNHDKIMYGFIGAVFVGIFLVMVFSIFQMIKAAKGKSDETPARVAIKAFKTLGIFLIVPAVMIIFTTLVNALMIVLYKATSMGADSMGDFLFKAFLPDGLDASNAFVDYRNVDSVSSFMETRGYDLSDYRFFFSWLCCIPLLFAIAKGLLNFVDRTISIVILFVTSPIPISSTIVDDGSHFKLWREQVLIKFLTGYGIIIGLNIYILIVSIISSNNVVFFDSTFLNFLFKIAFILGGAISLERVMALVGNLISSGAGSNELRDAAQTYEGMKGVARGVGKLAKGVAKAPIEAANLVKDIKQKGFKQVAAEKVGLRTDRDYKNMGYMNGSKKTVQEQILDAILGLGGDKKNQEQGNIQPNDAEPAFLAGEQTGKGDSNKSNLNKDFAALFGEKPSPDSK